MLETLVVILLMLCVSDGRLHRQRALGSSRNVNSIEHPEIVKHLKPSFSALVKHISENSVGPGSELFLKYARRLEEESSEDPMPQAQPLRYSTITIAEADPNDSFKIKKLSVHRKDELAIVELELVPPSKLIRFRTEASADENMLKTDIEVHFFEGLVSIRLEVIESEDFSSCEETFAAFQSDEHVYPVESDEEEFSFLSAQSGFSDEPEEDQPEELEPIAPAGEGTPEPYTYCPMNEGRPTMKLVASGIQLRKLRYVTQGSELPLIFAIHNAQHLMLTFSRNADKGTEVLEVSASRMMVEYRWNKTPGNGLFIVFPNNPEILDGVRLVLKKDFFCVSHSTDIRGFYPLYKIPSVLRSDQKIVDTNLYPRLYGDSRERSSRVIPAYFKLRGIRVDSERRSIVDERLLMVCGVDRLIKEFLETADLPEQKDMIVYRGTEKIQTKRDGKGVFNIANHLAGLSSLGSYIFLDDSATKSITSLPSFLSVNKDSVVSFQHLRDLYGGGLEVSLGDPFYGIGLPAKVNLPTHTKHNEDDITLFCEDENGLRAIQLITQINEDSILSSIENCYQVYFRRAAATSGIEVMLENPSVRLNFDTSRNTITIEGTLGNWLDIGTSPVVDREYHTLPMYSLHYSDPLLKSEIYAGYSVTSNDLTGSFRIPLRITTSEFEVTFSDVLEIYIDDKAESSYLKIPSVCYITQETPLRLAVGKHTIKLANGNPLYLVREGESKLMWRLDIDNLMVQYQYTVLPYLEVQAQLLAFEIPVQATVEMSYHDDTVSFRVSAPNVFTMSNLSPTRDNPSPTLWDSMNRDYTWTPQEIINGRSKWVKFDSDIQMNIALDYGLVSGKTLFELAFTGPYVPITITHGKKRSDPVTTLAVLENEFRLSIYARHKKRRFELRIQPFTLWITQGERKLQIHSGATLKLSLSYQDGFYDAYLQLAGLHINGDLSIAWVPIRAVNIVDLSFPIRMFHIRVAERSATALLRGATSTLESNSAVSKCVEDMKEDNPVFQSSVHEVLLQMAGFIIPGTIGLVSGVNGLKGIICSQLLRSIVEVHRLVASSPDSE